MCRVFMAVPYLSIRGTGRVHTWEKPEFLRCEAQPGQFTQELITTQWRDRGQDNEAHMERLC